MEIYRNKKEQTASYIVFAIYVLLLCWLVLFKFATSIYAIPHIQGINLIPFYYEEENSVHLKEILYNALVFFPAGFYFAAFSAKKSIWLAPLLTAALSLLFEITQWLFAIGASDITDIIMNTVGGICGMLVFVLLGKITEKYRMTIANVTGAVIEIAGVLFAVLLLSNR